MHHCTPTTSLTLSLSLSLYVFTFLLHSAANFCSSLDLVETFTTVGELANFSSPEHFTRSFSCDFWAVVSRPLKARTSSWECLCLCCSPSNFVSVKQCSACNVFICSWALQSWELSWKMIRIHNSFTATFSPSH